MSFVRLTRADGSRAEAWVAMEHIVWVAPEGDPDGPTVVVPVSGITLVVEESVAEVMARISGAGVAQ